VSESVQDQILMINWVAVGSGSELGLGSVLVSEALSGRVSVRVSVSALTVVVRWQVIKSVYVRMCCLYIGTLQYVVT